MNTKCHIHNVLLRLYWYKLYAKLLKYESYNSKVKYLKFILRKDGVCLDSSQIVMISDWPEPKSVKNVQAFFGLTSYFQ